MPAGRAPAARDAGRAGRVLFADVMAPVPERTAMSVRSAQLLSFLVRAGFAVDFMATHDRDDGAGAATLARLGVTDLGIRAADAAAGHAAAHADAYDLAVVAWAEVAHRLIPAIRARAPHAFVVFDTLDVNHVREFRYARATGNARALKRALVLKSRELGAVRAADCTVAISPDDAAIFRAAVPEARIMVATLAAPEPRPPGPRGGAELLFVGHYHAPHNYDAALLLAREILPRVRAAVPEATLTLAGSDPPAEIRALAGAAIRVPGWVADLAPLRAAARVLVAPLRFGSGVKGKMLDAMADGLPLVASAIAAEGIALRDGRDMLLAEGPEATAAAAVRVLRDPALGPRLAAGAAAVCRRDHSAAAVEAQLAAILALRPGGGGVLPLR